MDFDRTQFVRVLKRLQEAEGYLELGMTEHTLRCLEGLGELGPFEPAAEMLRGKALWMQHRYDDAAASLRVAAHKFDAPHDRPAWLALSLYYRRAGDMNRAVQSLARARGAHLPKRKPKSRH